MPTLRVRCADCAARRERLELTGKWRVIDCSPIEGKAGWCLLTYKSAARDRRADRVKTLAQMPGVRGRVEVSEARKVPRRLFDLDTPPSRAAPRRIAETFLRKLAPRIKIAPDLSELRFDKVKKTLLGSHVLFQQQHLGKDVSGAWIRVDVAPDGRVYNVQNDLIPRPLVVKGAREAAARLPESAKPLSKRQAVAAAFAASPVRSGGTRELMSAELMYGTQFSKPRLTWKMVVHTTRPIAEWKLYLDGYSGEVITRQNVIKTAAARGRVFDPSPVATLSNVRLTDKSTIPAAAYFSVILPDVAKSGFLDGPFVSTADTARRVKPKGRRFEYERGERGFTEVMAYFHIDRVQRYLQKIGFTDVMAKPIKVNVAGTREDNSFYSPARKSLSFGTGGVDDAEDADIIVHEYGHAIQDAQCPGFGETVESMAMGEGFGDYLAASLHADLKPARMRPTFANWDAVVFGPADPPCLRRLDGKKKYPQDMRTDEHDNGEIWSACLWQLRAAVGRRVADKVVIAHHFLINRRARFEDAANALLTADQQLYDGVHAGDIRKIFVARGILPKKKKGGGPK
jgi:Zn-dependent metalloprotease